MAVRFGPTPAPPPVNQGLPEATPVAPGQPLPPTPERVALEAEARNVSARTLLRFRWLAGLREIYEREYANQREERLAAFNAMRLLSYEQKSRIFGSVDDAFRRASAYDAFGVAFAPLIVRQYLYGRFLGPVVAIAALLLWLGDQRSLSHWSSLIPLTVVVTGVGGVLVSAAWQPIGIAGSLRSRLLALFAIVVLPVSLVELRHIAWLPPLVWDAMRAGIIGATLIAWSAAILIGYFVGFEAFAAQLRRRASAEHDVVDRLTMTLASVETGSLWSRWAAASSEIERTAGIVRELEFMALSLEHLLEARVAIAADPGTAASLRKATCEITAGARALKQYAILPCDGDRDRLLRALTSAPMHAVERHWGLLERVQPPAPGVALRARLVGAGRKLASAALPLAAAAALQLVPLQLTPSARDSLMTAAVGWAVLALLGWLDPDSDKRVGSLKDVLAMYGGKAKE